jgi:hypothetical protein
MAVLKFIIFAFLILTNFDLLYILTRNFPKIKLEFLIKTPISLCFQRLHSCFLLHSQNISFFLVCRKNLLAKDARPNAAAKAWRGIGQTSLRSCTADADAGVAYLPLPA